MIEAFWPHNIKELPSFHTLWYSLHIFCLINFFANFSILFIIYPYNILLIELIIPNQGEEEKLPLVITSLDENAITGPQIPHAQAVRLYPFPRRRRFALQ